MTGHRCNPALYRVLDTALVRGNVMTITPSSSALVYLYSVRRAPASTAILVSFTLALFLLLMSSDIAAQGSLIEEVASADPAVSYAAQIQEFEFEFGPLDRRLLEPLAGLAELQFERGEFDAAAATLRRQLQITRNTFGFEDSRLLPLVDSLVRIEIARSDWQQVADYLDLRSQIFIGSFDESRTLEEGEDLLNLEDVAARMELANALSLQSGWLMQQVALTPTRDAIDSFFDARELDERVSDLAEDVIESLESLPRENSSAAEFLLLTQWLPLMYRQSVNDYSLVQLLNAQSGFSYDTIDYLVRREGGAINKLSSPGFSARSISGPMNRIPMLENGDPIGVGYLRDGYFGVRKMDIRLSDFLERQLAVGASDNDLASTRQALAAARIYRGDYLLLQNRGSGIREYREAYQLLLESGVDQVEIDSYFARPALIPAAQLRLTFDELKADKSESECLPNFTALSDRLATLAAPSDDTSSWAIELPHAEITVRFGVSRRGKATGVQIDEVGAEDAGLRRAVNRAMKDLQFRPAIADGRSQRLRDQCLLFRIPVLD
ncbi:MAG: hypothetical protein NWR63_03490 [OM182 bacterium]|jgi:hypothetical protein|nr:hypothetical protein [OM182 bacterium]